MIQTETKPGQDTIKHLYNTHFPSHTKVKAPTINPFKQIETNKLQFLYTDMITTEKIRKALTTFDSKKSPGPDELKPIIFQHLPPNIIKIIEFLYKASIALT